MSCRSLADALYDKGNFVTVQVGEREYYIKAVKQKGTHANLDDSVMHAVLICEEQIGGNYARYDVMQQFALPR